MDTNSKIPLYLQMMDNIIKQIEMHEYKEHDLLPSERVLCEQFSVSRITVRQTLQELEQEGYIYKKRGKGTFVAPKTYRQNLIELYSFTKEMKKQNKHPSTRILSFQLVTADNYIARKMELKIYEEVFEIVRLRLADEEALMYETSYIPKKFFRWLTQKDLENRSMYDIFYEDYQFSVTKAIERFSTTKVEPGEFEYLKTSINQPAMLIKRFAYHNNCLIEYTQSIARGDAFVYTVELK